MKQSRFLKKEDVKTPILATIAGVKLDNVGTRDDPSEKYVLEFVEDYKPMVLNTTNANIIAEVTGSEDTDYWTNHQIVLYYDKNVSYAGKLIGGIRVRAPRTPQARPAPAPAARPRPTPPQPIAPPPPPAEPEPAEPAEDDVPF